MTLLFNIIYKTKANGTHHRLAMDALRMLDGEQAESWRRLFLKHADIYLEGSKAPDKEFKDFRNHVLHVGDEFWGGAPDKAQIWYQKLVRALTDKQFEEAVYCAGVLSHYYTDPIQPFHTAQSEAENNMHRAVEWSINKSYNKLRQRGLKEHGDMQVEPGSGDDWVIDMVQRGATRSHQYYDALISNYNLERGVVEPVDGLNENCHRFLSELVIYAAHGFARILDRAIIEAAVAPPKVALSIDSFVAGLGIPLRWVLRKLSDAKEIAAVQAAYDELQATGKVEDNLSEDDRAVRTLHRREVLERRSIRKDKRATRPRKPVKAASPVPKIEQSPSPAPSEIKEKLETPPAPPAKEAKEVKEVKEKRPDRAERAPRFYLEIDDEVEKGPSIGVKTAKRLEAVGVITIKDLLASNPADLSAELDTRWITRQEVSDWQDQARLVCEVAGLRGGHAQILTKAGVRTSRSLASMEAGEVHALMTLYCQTKNGQRLRACENIPDMTRVESWIKALLEHPRSVAA